MHLNQIIINGTGLFYFQKSTKVSTHMRKITYIKQLLILKHYRQISGEEKMNYKNIILISILFLLFSVAAVSANEIDNSYVTESSDSLSTGDSFLGSSEIQGSNDLAASTESFDDLQVEINNAPVGSV